MFGTQSLYWDRIRKEENLNEVYLINVPGSNLLFDIEFQHLNCELSTLGEYFKVVLRPSVKHTLFLPGFSHSCKGGLTIG